MLEPADKLAIGQNNLSDLIRIHARRHGDKAAFIMGDEQLSWAKFNSAVDVMAADVVQRHVDQTGQIGCVGCIGANTTWAYTVMFGIVRAGAVSTFLSNMLSVDVLLRLVDDADLSVLYVGRDEVTLAHKLTAQRPNLTLVVEGEDLGLLSSPLAGVAVTQVSLSEPFSVTYSSGTTGVPKGIVHSHFSRLCFANDLSRQFDIDSESICLISTPPYSNGTNICLLPAIFHGATMVLLPKFSVNALCDLANRYRFSHSFMVPTQYQTIVYSDRALQCDWSAIVTLITAGAPMTTKLRAHVLSIFGPKLAELWGLTEGVGTVLRKDEMLAHGGTVGRIGLGADIRLINPAGAEVFDGEGEIVGRSNMTMDGYLNRPDENELVQWLSPDGLLYLRTGDIGAFDEQDYLTIRGRIKDMIIRGGFNVYPIDIEAELCRHPQVKDAAVLGIGDDHWGEVPVAFCRLHESDNENIKGGDVSQVMAWVNARLTKTQQLVDIELRQSDFPRNALGKVLKNELKQGYIERITQTAASDSHRRSE